LLFLYTIRCSSLSVCSYARIFKYKLQIIIIGCMLRYWYLLSYLQTKHNRFTHYLYEQWLRVWTVAVVWSLRMLLSVMTPRICVLRITQLGPGGLLPLSGLKVSLSSHFFTVKVYNASFLSNVHLKMRSISNPTWIFWIWYVNVNNDFNQNRLNRRNILP